MGFLSKIYERRGKAQRQAGIRGFMTGAGDVSVKGTGAARGGSPAGSPGSSPAARDFQARDASGPASTAQGDPQPKPRSTASRSRGSRSKPDPFDFETSRDAAVEEPPVSPSTRSPPSRAKPKPASRGGSPSPAGAAQKKPTSSRSPGTASASPSGSPGTFGAARDAVPSPRDDPGTTGPGGRGAAHAAADPFLPTPGKRRRVTFAEVDAFTLDEEEEEEDVDVPAHGRPDRDRDPRDPRDPDPFDFPEDGDVAENSARAAGGAATDARDARRAPRETTTTTTSPGPRPAWGVFGGSPLSSPDVNRGKSGDRNENNERVSSILGAPSPEWAKRAPAPSRSPSASPMDADISRKAKPSERFPHNAQSTYSPSAAMAMASPSPLREFSGSGRGGEANAEKDTALPESGDALAALDEAQYALSGLGADQPLAGRLACASSLVAIAADARYRRALAQHGLAPRLCRAALDLCASVVGAREGRVRFDSADDADGGVIARALAAERLKKTSPALGLSAAALLYLSTLELRAGEASALYAERDVAGILAGLMRRADFDAETNAFSGSGSKKGPFEKAPARRLRLDETKASDETEKNHSGGFGALLADGAETKALRTTRDALRSLKFLPHEAMDAPTLALLAAHRALAQSERAAARASQREARRRMEAEKNDDGETRDDDHEMSPEERKARRLEAEGDEATILGWSSFKESLAARGAVLETARLADEAARVICDAGARCFSNAQIEADPETQSLGASNEDKVPVLANDSARASRAMARLFRCMRVVEAATFGSPSCADACLFSLQNVSGSLAPAPDDVSGRCADTLRLVPMRVNDAIASPAPQTRIRGGAGDASIPPGGMGVQSRETEAGDERALADVVRGVRVTGIELSPCASPDREPFASLTPGKRDADDVDEARVSTGSKRRTTPAEDDAATAKRFRTAEALLLTPSPGSKRSGGGGGFGGDVAVALDAAGAFADAERDPAAVVPGGANDRAAVGAHDTRNARDERKTRERDAGRREGRKPKARGGGDFSSPAAPAADAETPTFNFSRVAAAVDASIAWLDDDKEKVLGRGGDSVRDSRDSWTMVHALLRAIPTLAAAAATAAHAVDAGGVVCGVRTSVAGGLGADPRLAAGTLRAAVCVLTNLTNENPAGCAAVRACRGGLETAASLIPWCAALEGLLPGAGPDAAARAAAAKRAGARTEPTTSPRSFASRRRGGDAADARQSGDPSGRASPGEGHDMLNAALCFLVNVAETDADARRVLRALDADAGAMEAAAPRASADDAVSASSSRGKKTRKNASAAKKKKAAATVAALASRHVGLVELLARVFVRAGGAGPVDEDGNLLLDRPTEGEESKEDSARDVDVSNGEVTAEMLERDSEALSLNDKDKEGDGLITQAYAALLVAFLVEGQPALRADVKCTLPEDGFAKLAGVLERFRAFHESLDSISEESRESLSRVIRWLRGT